MKAFQLVENGKPLQEVEIDKPSPGKNEILLKTVACGVCHTDCLLYTSPSPRD